MYHYTREELEAALQLIMSTIRNCEKAQPKFAEGTSQHTLLKNRIKALYLSKALISGENASDQYSKDELNDALSPVNSVISKCKKAQEKFEAGSTHHTRFRKIIEAMEIAKTLIAEELAKLE